MILLALAAQLSLAAPLNAQWPDIRALFRADDYPAHLQAEGKSAIVYSRTTVRADGSIAGCVAEETMGDARFEGYTCKIILKRAKFAPGRWSDGSAVVSVIRAPVSWLVFEVPPPPEKLIDLALPDMELQVNTLPKGAPHTVPVDLVVAVDQDGKILECVDRPPLEGSRIRHFPELASVACRQAIAQLRLMPPKDEAGEPVRSVQNVLVHMKASKK